MSDFQQAPEWWQASDGRWYPPQPTTRPAPPISSDRQIAPDWWQASDGRWYPSDGASPSLGVRQSAGSGRRTVSGGLSGTLQGFLWVNGALAVGGATSALGGLVAYSDWENSSTALSERAAFRSMVDADEAVQTFASLGVLPGLVTFILMVIWVNQSHKASQQRWTGDRKWGSGWTVGAWFIPAANLILPKLVMSETERIGAAASADGAPVADGWQKRQVSGVGTMWWVLFVISLLVARFGVSLTTDVDDDVWGVGYLLLFLGQATLAIAAVLGALYVRKVSRYFRP